MVITDTSSSHINLIDNLSGALIDDAKVPETFNVHLFNVGRHLAEKFNTTASALSNLYQGVDHSFEFGEISITEVENLVKKIKTYKSSAVNGLPSRLLKDSFLALLPQLTHLFNCSPMSGKFPTKWKKPM